MGWKGGFSYGNLAVRELHQFTGLTHSNSLLSWDRVDIDKDNYRSISPYVRSHGIGAFNQDIMLNFAALRDSNGRISSDGNWWTNSGITSGSSASQVTTLGSRPSVFWNAHRWNYLPLESAGIFSNQNNTAAYSLWRWSDGSNIITDMVGGNQGASITLNIGSDWDSNLFIINGQGKGSTANGSPFTKIVVPVTFVDFFVSRPLLMSLTGGLPRPGGDVVSKDEPGDAWWRVGEYDYYLNYYPKYDGTSKKLLAKDDGMDWYGLGGRTQIDGSQPLPLISAGAESFGAGYSKVVKKSLNNEADYVCNNSKSISSFSNNSSQGWKGLFSWGKLSERHLNSFTGFIHSTSLLSWNDIDINSDNYRSISPRARSYGVGAYSQDSMLNTSSYRSSNIRSDTGWGAHYSNSDSVTASITQVTALSTKPSVFWDARRYDYATYGSAGSFSSQNSTAFYSFWRITDSSDLIADIVGGGRGAVIVLNTGSDWDDQLFAVNGQGKGNTANGSPFNKIVVPAGYTDFSVSRPLLMSLTGGLSRNGGDIINKNEPADAYHLAADYDYYLNYYPKYDETSKKLLAKNDGLDWFGLQIRPQIDGTKPASEIVAGATSHAAGYSKVCDLIHKTPFNRTSVAGLKNNSLKCKLFFYKYISIFTFK